MRRLRWKLLMMLLCVFNSNSTYFVEDVDQIYNLDLTSRGRSFAGLRQHLIEALTKIDLAPGKNVELRITPPEGAGKDYDGNIIETINELLPRFLDTSDTCFTVDVDSEGPLSDIKVKISCGFKKMSIIGDFFKSVGTIIEPFTMKVSSIAADIKSKVTAILEKPLLEILKITKPGQKTSFVISVEPPEDSQLIFKERLDRTIGEYLLQMTSRNNQLDYTVNEKLLHEKGKLKKIEYTINVFVSPKDAVFEIDLTKANVDQAIYMRRLFSKFLVTEPGQKCPTMYVQIKEKQDISELSIANTRITAQNILNEMFSQQTFSVITQKSETNPNVNMIDLFVNCEDDDIDKRTSRALELTIGGNVSPGSLGTQLVIDLTRPGPNLASKLKNILPGTLPNILSELRKKNSVKLSFSIKPPMRQTKAYVESARNDLLIELKRYFPDYRVNIIPRPLVDSLGFLQVIFFEVTLDKMFNSMGIVEEGSNIPKNLFNPGDKIALEISDEVKNILPKINADLKLKQQVSFQMIVDAPKNSNSHYMIRAQEDLITLLCFYFPNYGTYVVAKVENGPLGNLKHVIFYIHLKQKQIGDIIPMEVIRIYLDKPNSSLHNELSMEIQKVLTNFIGKLNNNKIVSLNLLMIPPPHKTVDYIKKSNREILLLMKNYFPNRQIEWVPKILYNDKGYLVSIVFKIDIHPDKMIDDHQYINIDQWIITPSNVMNLVDANSSEASPSEANPSEGNPWDVSKQPAVISWKTITATSLEIKAPEVNSKSPGINQWVLIPIPFVSPWMPNPPEEIGWDLDPPPGASPWNNKNQAPGFDKCNTTKPDNAKPWEANYPGMNPWDVSKPPGTNPWDINNQPGGNPWDSSKYPGGNSWQAIKPPGGNPWESSILPGTNPFDASKPPGTNPWEINNQPGASPWETTKPPGGNPWEATQQPGGNTWQAIKPPGGNPLESSILPGTNPFDASKPPGTNPWEINNHPGASPWETTKPPGRNPWEATQQPDGNLWEATKPPGENSWDSSKPPGGNPWESSIPPGGNPWETTKPPGGNPWDSSKPPSGNPWEATEQPGENPWDSSKPPGRNPWEATQQPDGNPWEATKPPGGNPWDSSKPPGGNPWEATKPPGENPWDSSKPPGGNSWQAIKPPSGNPLESSIPPGMNPFDVSNPSGTNPLEINNQHGASTSDTTKPPGGNPWEATQQPDGNPWDSSKPPGGNPWDSSKPPGGSPWDSSKPPGGNPWDSSKPPGGNPWDSSKPPGGNPWDSSKPPGGNTWEATKPPGGNPWDSSKPPGGNPWDSSKPPGGNPWDSSKPPGGNPWEATKPPGGNPWDSSKPPGGNPWDSSKPPGGNPWEATKPPGGNPWDSSKPPGGNPWDSSKPPGGNPWDSSKPPGGNPWDSSKPPGGNPWEATKPPGGNPWDSSKPPGENPWESSIPPRMEPFDVSKPPGTNPLEINNQHGASPSETTKPTGENPVEATKPPGANPWGYTEPPEVNTWNVDVPPAMNTWETTTPPGVDQKTSTNPPGTNSWEDRPPIENKSDVTTPTLRTDIRDVVINDDIEIEDTVISTVRKYLVYIKSMLDNQQHVEISFVVPDSDVGHYQWNDVMPILSGIFQQYLPNVIIKLNNDNNNRFRVDINPIRKITVEIDLGKPGQHIREIIHQKLFEVKNKLVVTLSEDKKVELVLVFLKPDNGTPIMVLEITRMLDDMLKKTFPDTQVKFSVEEKNHSDVEIVVDLSTNSPQSRTQKEPTNFVVSIKGNNMPPINMIDGKIKSIYTTLKAFLDERKPITLVFDVDLPLGSNDSTVRKIIDHLNGLLGQDFPSTSIGITPYLNRNPQNLLTEVIIEVSLNSYKGSVQVENILLDLSNPHSSIITEIGKVIPNTVEIVRMNLIKGKPVTLNLQIRPPEKTKEWFVEMLPDAILPLLTSPFCNNDKHWSISANSDLDGHLVDISMVITFDPSELFAATECKQIILIDLRRPDSWLDVEIDKYLPTVYPDIQMYLGQRRTQSLDFKILPPPDVNKDYIKKTEKAFMKILQNYFPYNEVEIRVSAESNADGSLSNVLMTLTIKPEANPLPPAPINLLLDLSDTKNVELSLKNVLHKYRHLIKTLLSKDKSASVGFKIIPPRGVDEDYSKQLSSTLLKVMDKSFKQYEKKVISKAGKNSKGEIFIISAVVTLTK